MSTFVQASDFQSGRFTVATNQYSTTRIQELIDAYEPHYIYKIFGVSLGTEVIEAESPISAPILAVINPFVEQDSCGTIYESKGLKETLMGMIYLKLIEDAKTNPSLLGGNVVPETEVSVQVIDAKMYDYYNEGVRSARAIQYKCMNSSDYPNFRGVKIYFNSAL